MSHARERSCPLCGASNRSAARRCPCGYVFEFDAPAPTPSLRRAGSVPAADGVYALIAVMAAVAAAALMASSVGRTDPATQGSSIGWFLIAAGGFTAVGAIANWSWFFRAWRARVIATILGRSGARVFYALLGGALAGTGVWLVAG